MSKRWRLPFNARQPSALLYLAGCLTMQRKTESQSPRVHFCIADVRRPTSCECCRKSRQVLRPPSAVGCSGSVLRKQVSFRNASVCRHNGNISSRQTRLTEMTRLSFIPNGRPFIAPTVWPIECMSSRKTALFSPCSCASTVPTRSKPVEAGRRRQAATAPWYEGVSELFRLAPLPTVVAGYAVVRPSLLPPCLWKRTITPQQIPHTVFLLTELTGIKRALAPIEPVRVTTIEHRLHFWPKPKS